MNNKNGILSSTVALAWALALAMSSSTALADDVYLRAERFDKTVDDGAGGTTVPMWGYSLCTGTGGVFDGGSCGIPTSPGPTIRMQEGTDLTIYVDNQLPAGLTNVTNETSVLIPALPKGLSPVRWTGTGDPARENRIYSFDAVTANGAIAAYTWTMPKPGTYLYHSGTHPQVQVQMGLYGAVVIDANTSAECTAAPCAYSDVPYYEDKVVVFSEIDPDLHTAVDTDVYGTAGGPTSTEIYVPRYFLINGESYPAPELDSFFTAAVNTGLLFRFVNAGIEDHAPQLLGAYFDVIAEDGHRKPARRSQYSLLLPAGKSMDALASPDSIGSLTLFDRRLRTVNNTGANGGMFAKINVVNTAPIADAGPNQNVLVTDTVTLDGGGSSDLNGDTLTYAWTFITVPATSTVTDGDLSDATAVGPTFDPDVDGEYVVQLIVNDGTVDSAPDTVSITTAPNTPPVAVAGPDQTVPYGVEATLDGTGSNDDDGNELTYAWTFISVPVTSAVTDGDLSDATAASPTFTPDVAGEYVAQVIVNDGIVDSAPDTVMITAENTAPVADAGPDQGATTGSLTTLNGGGSSDTNGDALNYAWTITAAPALSTVTTGSLSDATAAGPTFTPDLPGLYKAQLIVNDGTTDSPADTVDITAIDPVLNIQPIANAGPDQNVVKSVVVQLNGGLSSDGDTDPLSYAWQLTIVPAGSTATLSDPAAVNPTFTADLAGAYTAQLIVNDGTEDSIPDLVLITATNTAPVADAGGNMNAVVGNPVQLDGSGSSDANGDSLDFAWQLTVPAGSSASLSNAAIVNPTFVPDVAGDYIAQLIVNDGTVDSPADSGTTTAIAGGGGTGPFEQTGGIASMEAEHFATNNAASGIAEWILLDPAPNASGIPSPMAIKSASGAQTYTTGAGPSITYEVQLDAGTQYVWLRFRAFSYQSDSVYVQLDDGPIQTRTLSPINGQWSWVELSSPFTVGTADVHTVTIYRRERDAELDKLVLTTDPGFNPAAVAGGLGPDESPRVGGGGNTPPMSNAGPDQNVKTTEVVQLNGGGSLDTDGDPLTFSWSLMSAPAGSTATLSDASIVNPTFTADVAGPYVVQLIVNDGLQNGLADSVTITAAPNTLPTANAGPDATVGVSDVVQLNGNGSSDTDGDSLTYAWDLFPIPAGSTATISNAALVNPTFTADLPGAYTATLIVHDGFDSSVADSVVITAENTAPVADAGPDEAVATTDVVQLDGSGSSDANGDALSYAWQLTTVPGGSAATLSDASLENPTFTADVDGDYIAELIVNDGTVDSPADTVTITASTGGGTGPFVQTAGTASMEAEHFTTNVGASGVAPWIVLDPSAGASGNPGNMAIKAAGGAQTYTTGAGPSVTYEVQLDAGAQYIWLRFKSFSFQTDSVYVQLDGGPIQTRTLLPHGNWDWTELSSPITVGTAGVHTLTIYRRERDAELDKIVLSTSPAFDPQPISGGLGPDESPRL